MSRKDLPTETRSDAAFRRFREPMKKAAVALGRKLYKANLHDLLAEHAVGKGLAQIADRPTVFGEDAFQGFAEYMGLPVVELSGMKSFADEFTRSFIVEQVRATMLKGTILTYGHFRQAMRPRSREKQEQLLRDIREKGLSVGQVRRNIAEYGPRPRRTPAPRRQQP